MESARPAGPDDLDDLARLWEEAVADLDGQRGGWALAGTLHRARLHDFLESALADGDRLLVVGSIDSAIVGLASFRVVRDRREPLGDLELIFVEPSARKVGVAACMLEVVLAHCRGLSLAGLDAPALPGNRNAKSFFEVHGMQARLLVMHLPLPPVAAPD